jgi:hypothetical protein
MVPLEARLPLPLQGDDVQSTTSRIDTRSGNGIRSPLSFSSAASPTYPVHTGLATGTNAGGGVGGYQLYPPRHWRTRSGPRAVSVRSPTEATSPLSLSGSLGPHGARSTPQVVVSPQLGSSGNSNSSGGSSVGGGAAATGFPESQALWHAGNPDSRNISGVADGSVTTSAVTYVPPSVVCHSSNTGMSTDPTGTAATTQTPLYGVASTTAPAKDASLIVPVNHTEGEGSTHVSAPISSGRTTSGLTNGLSMAGATAAPVPAASLRSSCKDVPKSSPATTEERLARGSPGSTTADHLQVSLRDVKSDRAFEGRSSGCEGEAAADAVTAPSLHDSNSAARAAATTTGEPAWWDSTSSLPHLNASLHAHFSDHSAHRLRTNTSSSSDTSLRRCGPRREDGGEDDDDDVEEVEEQDAVLPHSTTTTSSSTSSHLLCGPGSRGVAGFVYSPTSIDSSSPSSSFSPTRAPLLLLTPGEAAALQGFAKPPASTATGQARAEQKCKKGSDALLHGGDTDTSEGCAAPSYRPKEPVRERVNPPPQVLRAERPPGGKEKERAATAGLASIEPAALGDDHDDEAAYGVAVHSFQSPAAPPKVSAWEKNPSSAAPQPVNDGNKGRDTDEAAGEGSRRKPLARGTRAAVPPQHASRSAPSTSPTTRESAAPEHPSTTTAAAAILSRPLQSIHVSTLALPQCTIAATAAGGGSGTWGPSKSQPPPRSSPRTPRSAREATLLKQLRVALIDARSVQGHLEELQTLLPRSSAATTVSPTAELTAVAATSAGWRRVSGVAAADAAAEEQRTVSTSEATTRTTTPCGVHTARGPGCGGGGGQPSSQAHLFTRVVGVPSNSSAGTEREAGEETLSATLASPAACTDGGSAEGEGGAGGFTAGQDAGDTTDGVDEVCSFAGPAVPPVFRVGGLYTASLNGYRQQRLARLTEQHLRSLWQNTSAAARSVCGLSLGRCMRAAMLEEAPTVRRDTLASFTSTLSCLLDPSSSAWVGERPAASAAGDRPGLRTLSSRVPASVSTILPSAPPPSPAAVPRSSSQAVISSLVTAPPSPQLSLLSPDASMSSFSKRDRAAATPQTAVSDVRSDFGAATGMMNSAAVAERDDVVHVGSFATFQRFPTQSTSGHDDAAWVESLLQPPQLTQQQQQEQRASPVGREGSKPANVFLVRASPVNSGLRPTPASPTTANTIAAAAAGARLHNVSNTVVICSSLAEGVRGVSLHPHHLASPISLTGSANSSVSFDATASTSGTMFVHNSPTSLVSGLAVSNSLHDMLMMGGSGSCSGGGGRRGGGSSDRVDASGDGVISSSNAALNSPSGSSAGGGAGPTVVSGVGAGVGSTTAGHRVLSGFSSPASPIHLATFAAVASVNSNPSCMQRSYTLPSTLLAHLRSQPLHDGQLRSGDTADSTSSNNVAAGEESESGGGRGAPDQLFSSSNDRSVRSFDGAMTPIPPTSPSTAAAITATTSAAVTATKVTAAASITATGESHPTVSPALSPPSMQEEGFHFYPWHHTPHSQHARPAPPPPPPPPLPPSQSPSQPPQFLSQQQQQQHQTTIAAFPPRHSPTSSLHSEANAGGTSSVSSVALTSPWLLPPPSPVPPPPPAAAQRGAAAAAAAAAGGGGSGAMPLPVSFSSTAHATAIESGGKGGSLNSSSNGGGGGGASLPSSSRYNPSSPTSSTPLFSPSGSFSIASALNALTAQPVKAPFIKVQREEVAADAVPGLDSSASISVARRAAAAAAAAGSAKGGGGSAGRRSGSREKDGGPSRRHSPQHSQLPRTSPTSASTRATSTSPELRSSHHRYRGDAVVAAEAAVHSTATECGAANTLTPRNGGSGAGGSTSSPTTATSMSSSSLRTLHADFVNDAPQPRRAASPLISLPLLTLSPYGLRVEEEMNVLPTMHESTESIVRELRGGGGGGTTPTSSDVASVLPELMVLDRSRSDSQSGSATPNAGGGGDGDESHAAVAFHAATARRGGVKTCCRTVSTSATPTTTAAASSAAGASAESNMHDHHTIVELEMLGTSSSSSSSASRSSMVADTMESTTPAAAHLTIPLTCARSGEEGEEQLPSVSLHHCGKMHHRHHSTDPTHMYTGLSISKDSNSWFASSQQQPSSSTSHPSPRAPPDHSTNASSPNSDVGERDSQHGGGGGLRNNGDFGEHTWPPLQSRRNDLHTTTVSQENTSSHLPLQSTSSARHAPGGSASLSPTPASGQDSLTRPLANPLQHIPPTLLSLHAASNESTTSSGAEVKLGVSVASDPLPQGMSRRTVLHEDRERKEEGEEVMAGGTGAADPLRDGTTPIPRRSLAGVAPVTSTIHAHTPPRQGRATPDDAARSHDPSSSSAASCPSPQRREHTTGPAGPVPRALSRTTMTMQLRESSIASLYASSLVLYRSTSTPDLFAAATAAAPPPGGMGEGPLLWTPAHRLRSSSVPSSLPLPSSSSTLNHQDDEDNVTMIVRRSSSSSSVEDEEDEEEGAAMQASSSDSQTSDAAVGRRDRTCAAQQQQESPNSSSTTTITSFSPPHPRFFAEDRYGDLPPRQLRCFDLSSHRQKGFRETTATDVRGSAGGSHNAGRLPTKEGGDARLLDEAHLQPSGGVMSFAEVTGLSNLAEQPSQPSSPPRRRDSVVRPLETEAAADGGVDAAESADTPTEKDLNAVSCLTNLSPYPADSRRPLLLAWSSGSMTISAHLSSVGQLPSVGSMDTAVHLLHGTDSAPPHIAAAAAATTVSGGEANAVAELPSLSSILWPPPGAITVQPTSGVLSDNSLPEEVRKADSPARSRARGGNGSCRRSAKGDANLAAVAAVTVTASSNVLLSTPSAVSHTAAYMDACLDDDDAVETAETDDVRVSQGHTRAALAAALSSSAFSHERPTPIAVEDEEDEGSACDENRKERSHVEEGDAAVRESTTALKRRATSASVLTADGSGGCLANCDHPRELGSDAVMRHTPPNVSSSTQQNATNPSPFPPSHRQFSPVLQLSTSFFNVSSSAVSLNTTSAQVTGSSTPFGSSTAGAGSNVLVATASSTLTSTVSTATTTTATTATSGTSSRMGPSDSVTTAAAAAAAAATGTMVLPTSAVTAAGAAGRALDAAALASVAAPLTTAATVTTATTTAAATTTSSFVLDTPGAIVTFSGASANLLSDRTSSPRGLSTSPTKALPLPLPPPHHGRLERHIGGGEGELGSTTSFVEVDSVSTVGSGGRYGGQLLLSASCNPGAAPSTVALAEPASTVLGRLQPLPPLPPFQNYPFPLPRESSYDRDFNDDDDDEEEYEDDFEEEDDDDDEEDADGSAAGAVVPALWDKAEKVRGVPKGTQIPPTEVTEEEEGDTATKLAKEAAGGVTPAASNCGAEAAAAALVTANEPAEESGSALDSLRTPRQPAAHAHPAASDNEGAALPAVCPVSDQSPEGTSATAAELRTGGALTDTSVHVRTPAGGSDDTRLGGGNHKHSSDGGGTTQGGEEQERQESSLDDRVPTDLSEAPLNDDSDIVGRGGIADGDDDDDDATAVSVDSQRHPCRRSSSTFQTVPNIPIPTLPIITTPRSVSGGGNRSFGGGPHSNRSSPRGVVPRMPSPLLSSRSPRQLGVSPLRRVSDKNSTSSRRSGPPAAAAAARSSAFLHRSSGELRPSRRRSRPRARTDSPPRRSVAPEAANNGERRLRRHERPHEDRCSHNNNSGGSGSSRGGKGEAAGVEDRHSYASLKHVAHKATDVHHQDNSHDGSRRGHHHQSDDEHASRSPCSHSHSRSRSRSRSPSGSNASFDTVSNSTIAAAGCVGGGGGGGDTRHSNSGSLSVPRYLHRHHHHRHRSSERGRRSHTRDGGVNSTSTTTTAGAVAGSALLSSLANEVVLSDFSAMGRSRSGQSQESTGTPLSICSPEEVTMSDGRQQPRATPLQLLSPPSQVASSREEVWGSPYPVASTSRFTAAAAAAAGVVVPGFSAGEAVGRRRTNPDTPDGSFSVLHEGLLNLLPATTSTNTTTASTTVTATNTSTITVETMTVTGEAAVTTANALSSTAVRSSSANGSVGLSTEVLPSLSSLPANVPPTAELAGGGGEGEGGGTPRAMAVIGTSGVVRSNETAGDASTAQRCESVPHEGHGVRTKMIVESIDAATARGGGAAAADAVAVGEGEPTCSPSQLTCFSGAETPSRRRHGGALRLRLNAPSNDAVMQHDAEDKAEKTTSAEEAEEEEWAINDHSSTTIVSGFTTSFTDQTPRVPRPTSPLQVRQASWSAVIVSAATSTVAGVRAPNSVVGTPTLKPNGQLRSSSDDDDEAAVEAVAEEVRNTLPAERTSAERLRGDGEAGEGNEEEEEGVRTEWQMCRFSPRYNTACGCRRRISVDRYAEATEEEGDDDETEKDEGDTRESGEHQMALLCKSGSPPSTTISLAKDNTTHPAKAPTESQRVHFPEECEAGSSCSGGAEHTASSPLLVLSTSRQDDRARPTQVEQRNTLTSDDEVAAVVPRGILRTRAIETEEEKEVMHVASSQAAGPRPASVLMREQHGGAGSASAAADGSVVVGHTTTLLPASCVAAQTESTPTYELVDCDAAVAHHFPSPPVAAITTRTPPAFTFSSSRADATASTDAVAETIRLQRPALQAARASNGIAHAAGSPSPTITTIAAAATASSSSRPLTSLPSYYRAQCEDGLCDVAGTRTAWHSTTSAFFPPRGASTTLTGPRGISAVATARNSVERLFLSSSSSAPTLNSSRPSSLYAAASALTRRRALVRASYDQAGHVSPMNGGDGDATPPPLPTVSTLHSTSAGSRRSNTLCSSSDAVANTTAATADGRTGPVLLREHQHSTLVAGGATRVGESPSPSASVAANRVLLSADGRVSAGSSAFESDARLLALMRRTVNSA